jgi:sporulation protein YlmC with PRC-barrel domain
LGREDPGSIALRLTDILGLEVRTESGDRLGRVHDVRGELTSRTLRVTGLVVGRLGLLERFGFSAPKSSARIRAHDVVPWSAVVRADRRGVIVEDGTEPR